MSETPTSALKQDLEELAAFRAALRRYLKFSERAVRRHGLTPQQYQLLLAVMSFPGPDWATVGELAEELDIRPNSVDLDRRGIRPPIDVLPSLSRLMNAGIGEGRTRADHRALADQLYASYARGREVRQLMSIVGEHGLPEPDRRSLAFADAFEREFLGQGDERRTLDATLDLGWRLLEPFPDNELRRLSSALIAEYRVGATGSAGS
ncbi:MarR family transcriptional regulator [Glaciibacter superstes]|uniref:ATP synthase beta subunit C-terminal domain-containing protein n=1 Tax=Glaciibacter superstes TaxID=501023 RepID=UPI0003B3109A|nr:MarR family transcriptional regulator [Glaciibacter superstes]